MDVLDRMIIEMDEKVQQLKDHLAAGRAQTHEDYKHLCGEIRGLLFVRGYLTDLKSHLETSDNE